MKTLYDFTDYLLSKGKNFFSKQEALTSLGISPNQFVHQAYRLSKKGIIRKLERDFFMIIPAEYRTLGSLPPHWIISPFMEHVGGCYYIGLLSAASLYGATEQQPMVFQVIVEKPIKKILLPRGAIEFHVKSDCSNSVLETITAPTGYTKRSTKEQTIVDLVGYYKSSGGLSNVALIIKDLGPECSPRALQYVIDRETNTSLLQRLGYLLEFTKLKRLAKIVERSLAKRTHFYIPLRPDSIERTGERLPRWKIILNDYVEL